MLDSHVCGSAAGLTLILGGKKMPIHPIHYLVISSAPLFLSPCMMVSVAWLANSNHGFLMMHCGILRVSLIIIPRWV